jgi:hypothetical protein
MTTATPIVRVVGQLGVVMVQPVEDREWEPQLACGACNRTIGPEGGFLLYQRPVGTSVSHGLVAVHSGQCLELIDPVGQLWRVDLSRAVTRLATNTTGRS